MVSRLDQLQRQYSEITEKAKAARKVVEKLRKEQDRTEKRKETIAARKARNQKIFAVGGLAEIAGLLNLDKGMLLGAFIAISKAASNPANQHTLDNWKTAGDALLAEREAAHKKGRIPPAFPYPRQLTGRYCSPD